MINQKSGRSNESKPSLLPTLLLTVGLFGLGIGLLVFGFYRSSHAAPVQSQPNCQSLIKQAILYTGQYCNQIGANKGCYGNTTIQAKMMTNSSQRFSERGDVADINQIKSISAEPLNLITHDWGIAIFRVLGNLPGSVPGEMVTLMVFGNTKLDRTSTGLDSFYFSSALGQIVCGEVPMDGILINMPNGAGWVFDVNGTELSLMGNASLKANKNGTMMVGLYNGAAQITSEGQTQYFGAGQSVSVILGGAEGDQAVSPPSVPTSLSPQDLRVACIITGNYCTSNAISPVSPVQAKALIQPGLTLDPSTLAPSFPSPLSASTNVSPEPQSTTVLSFDPPMVSINTPVPPNPSDNPNPSDHPKPPSHPKPPAPKCGHSGHDCSGKDKGKHP